MDFTRSSGGLCKLRRTHDTTMRRTAQCMRSMCCRLICGDQQTVATLDDRDAWDNHWTRNDKPPKDISFGNIRHPLRYYSREHGPKAKRAKEWMKGRALSLFKESKKMRYAGEGERENEKPQDIATGAHWQNRGSPRRLELVQSHHAHRDIGVLDHFTELLKADLAIQILVRLHHGLIHNLLQLLVLKITPNHHLEDDK